MSNIHEKLQQHQKDLTQLSLSALVASEKNRVADWSFEEAGLRVDFAKNFVNQDTKALWAQWWEKAGLREHLADLHAGKAVNNSEDRPALHHRLRTPAGKIDDAISRDVAAVHEQLRQISEKAAQSAFVGFSGKAITDVVHIGIGGSELGPRLVCHALEHLKTTTYRLHFLASPDAYYLNSLQSALNPETTLCIIASKSFTTEETLHNAEKLRTWLHNAAQGADISGQFFALTAKPKLAEAWGVSAEQILPLWDFVGGRYSLWSSIALPLVLQNGYEQYQALLAGAHEMDEHFQHAPYERNIPVLLATLDAWYNHYFQYNNRAMITYCQPLRDFVPHIQQLEMESLGKRADKNGQPLPFPSGMLIWGGAGTDAQHAYFQLLHQGHRNGAMDFITVKQAPKGFEDTQALLHSHYIAQQEAFMMGQSEEDLSHLPESKRFERTNGGNRPTTSVVLSDLTPRTVGALVAMYEHKTSAQGVLYGLNAYDQWGVEYGKKLASAVQEELLGRGVGEHDVDTVALIGLLKRG
ncbi:MAG: glucose-6-phosphate isomerase [Cardiobacteriaceae bacterium]|nr:glucose-6-phosphate isomerase [Cardiobacteriaceae bacterium]